jgi:O-antigen/teichoic acid export membrane protein
MQTPLGKFSSVLIKAIPPPLRRYIECYPGLLRILDNIGWLFFDKILRMGVGLLVGVWLARYLGPDQFGQMSYAVAFVSLFGVVAGLGLSGVVVRDIVRDPKVASCNISTAFFLQAFAGLVAMLMSTVAIGLLRSDDKLTVFMISVLSIGLIFKASDSFKYWYEANIQSRYVVWVENGIFLLMALCRIGLILMKANLMSFIWLMLIESILIFLGLLWIYIKKNKSIAALFQASFQHAIYLLKESWPLLLAGIAITLYTRIDLVMLESMSNSREVGIYAAATKISEIWYFIPTIIVASLSPSIISSYSINRNQYLQRLKGLYFTMTWLAIAISLPISFLSNPIVSLLYGAEYQDAGPVLAIHLWASVAVFLGVASSQYLLIEHLQKISLYRTLIGLLCNVALNLLLIPSMGAKGAAIATLISYFVATFALVFFKATRNHGIYLLMSLIVRK